MNSLGYTAGQTKPQAAPKYQHTKTKSGRSGAAGRAMAPDSNLNRVHRDSPKFQAKPGQFKVESLRGLQWQEDLKDFMQRYGSMRTNDFDKKVSAETQRNRTDIMRKTLRLLIRDMRLNCIGEMRPRHVERIFELWEDSGISKATQTNYFNVMKWFWAICGERLKPLKHYESYVGEYKRMSAATKDLSWGGNDVEYEEIYQAIKAEDPVAGRILQTMKTFGLRLKEAICLRPHESAKGDSLQIARGTKNGRPRDIRFDHFDQVDFRKVVDALLVEVPEGRHMGWEGRDLKQAKRRMYTLFNKHGLTRKKLGVTGHGLRHDFAIDQLQALGGITAPIRGGVTINYRELSAVRQKITQAMGHGRNKITAAYYGSFLSMERKQKNNFQASWNRLEPVAARIWALMQEQGADNLYWVGDRAMGASASDSAPYAFVLPPGLATETVNVLAPQIAELFLGATGIDCSVQMWEHIPATKKALYESEAVPVFSAISPLELAKARMSEWKKTQNEKAYAKLGDSNSD